jgi:precorrin-6B methylase 2
MEHTELTKQFIKTEQIGNVAVKYIGADRKDAPVYCDGEGENQLYMKFKRDPNYKGHQGDEKFGSWVEEYHLSEVRHNLLKWLSFAPQSTVLEVGAGCGALTGLLCEKSERVMALEYSKQRALITAMRHSHRSNLEVIVGGLQDFESDQKFDYITVIGVLEYAGTFYGMESPHESFLDKLRGMLKPTGALILAIENKLGLKYICGAQEDHTGRMYDSIYDYPYSSKARTFSKKELAGLLNVVGFGHLEWYYPFPDYKMPQEVISEEIVPGDLDSVWRLFPAKTGRRRRKEIVSEKRFGKTIAQAGLFGEFANSFLVIARLKDSREKLRCLRFIGANMQRKSQFRTNKQICRNGREKRFVLSSDNDKGVEFLHDVIRREALASRFFDDKAEVVRGSLDADIIVYPYISHPTMVELMAGAITGGDMGFGRYWIDKYLQFLRKLPAEICVPKEFLTEMGLASREIHKPLPCLCCGIVDCVPHNIIVDDKNQKWHIIDNEFTYDFAMPIDFLICRAIRTLVVDLQSQIQSRVSESRPVILFSGHGANRHYIPLAWFDVLTNLEISLKQQARWCAAFQNRILCHRYKAHGKLRAKYRVLRHVPIAELNRNQGLVEQVYRILRKVKRML